MSEHAWVLENIAGYHAGGLEADECERLQQHIAACEPCAQALKDAGGIDRTLEALFADIRPDPALEDRMVRALRAEPVRSIWNTPLSVWGVSGAAAVLLVGVLGAGLSNLVVDGRLLFPGMPIANNPRASARNDLKQLGLAAVNASSRFVAGKDGITTQALVESRDANELVDERRASNQSFGEKLSAAFSNLSVEGTSSIRAGSDKGVVKQNLRLPSAHTGVVAIDKDVTRSDSKMVQSFGEKITSGIGAGSDNGVVRENVIMRDLTSESKMVQPGGPITEATAPNLYTYRNELPAPAAGQPSAGWFSPGKLVAAVPQDQGSKTPQSKEGDRKAAEPKLQDGESEGKSKGGQEASRKPGSDQGKPSDQKKTESAAPAPVMQRKIIRSGDIEFEIESFDSAVATITKLVNEIKGGFVATVNSEKLANGKVRGSVVVRIPPERLDTLVLDLRRELGKGGELKGQRIGSQDITKQYTDLESRLRAARAMEERLLQVIKTGKGEIKDLVQAEKELGVWRTKIEETEGELRYYANLVALSTLTITLYEREIRAPFAVIETERIQMGVEVEDVEQAQRQVLAAVAEAKGRVTKSELKQHAAGQYSALLHFEVAPEAAGPVRDRLKQLGTVARLEIDRLQQTEGGSGRPQDAKSKRSDAQFIVALYNLANVAPRETVILKLVCGDVEAVYKAILARIGKAAGRVVTSNLSRQKTEQTTATINFEVRAAEADAVLESLKETGEVMRLQVTENPDVQNATKSKRGFNVELWALGQVAPRETSVLQLATRDVPAGYRALQEAVAKAKGRIINAQLNEQDNQNITAQVDFEARRADGVAIDAALAKIGDVYSRNVVRAQDNENVIDSKVRLQVSLINAANLKPRENVTLAIEVANVENTAAAISAMVSESRGRTVVSQLTHRRDGSVVAKLVFDVPLAASSALAEKFKTAGTLRLQESSQNPQVPEVALAVARLDVTLSNTELIVPTDDGLWPQVRKGLSNSLLAIFLSLSWVIFGLLVVLPWALLIYGVYRLVLRLRKRPGSATTTA